MVHGLQPSDKLAKVLAGLGSPKGRKPRASGSVTSAGEKKAKPAPKKKPAKKSKRALEEEEDDEEEEESSDDDDDDDDAYEDDDEDDLSFPIHPSTSQDGDDADADGEIVGEDGTIAGEVPLTKSSKATNGFFATPTRSGGNANGSGSGSGAKGDAAPDSKRRKISVDPNSAYGKQLLLDEKRRQAKEDKDKREKEESYERTQI